MITSVACQGQNVDETVKALHIPTSQQEALSRLERIAANLPGMIFQFLQLQDGSQVVTYASSGCRELFELEPEVVQQDFHILYKLTHPQDIEALDKSIATSCATEEPWLWEGRIITPSGKLKWIQGASRPERLSSGDVIWDGLMIDITDRKQTEAALRSVAEKFATVFRSSPNPIAISTLAEGRYIEVNESFVEQSGYQREETIGRTAFDLNIWVNQSDRTTMVQQLQQTGWIRNLECEFRRKSGEVRTVLLSAEMITLEGETYILGVINDITERKQSENLLKIFSQQLTQLNANLERQVEERTSQLQQKMLELQELHRLKRVVLHTVSHELRTSVMGNLMVLNNFLTPKLGSGNTRTFPTSIPVPHSIIERMIQGNERQMQMIESLLELHSCEAQGLALHQESVSLSTIVETAIQDLKPLLTQHQATVKNFLPKDLPLIYADPAKFKKVFINLLTHSWQHNPPGLKFTLKASVQTGKMRLTIQDNGVNMSQMECDRLFDLHVRDPQSPCLTSIGLNMFLCRQIIKAHGGEIGATSNRKRGITFWLTLPLAASRS